MLKIKDIKLLLQNPRHQISYIHVEHNLEPTCLAYLTAFPYLRHLVLYGVIKAFSIPHNPAGIDGYLENFEKPNEAVNPNPVFRKLVENTPHLKDFALSTKYNNPANPWDLTVLHSIARWKELTTLFPSRIPIVNGNFLVEIGIQCKNLEKLRLEDIGPYNDFCYKNELSEMLIHCRNLRDFSIAQNNIGQVSDVLEMLAKNPKLRRLGIKSFGEEMTFDNLVLSMETMIRSHELILLWCEFEKLSVVTRDNLRSIVQKLKDELNLTAFEFVIMDNWELDELGRRFRNPSLQYAHNDLLLEHKLTNALYQLGC